MIFPYYDRNGITIYCGECLESMRLLEPPFDAIICDLPYGITACAWDTIIPFEPLWENYKRLVKKDGAVVLFGNQPFTSKLVMSNLEWFKYEWIWKKTLAANFMNAKLKPLQRHENILVFSKGATSNGNTNNMIYNPQGLKKVDEPWKRPAKYPSEHNLVRKSHKLERVIEFSGYPDSILEFSNGNNAVLHPTQKPLSLLENLVRTYTNPGDLILDNCIGSGTTLVAAQNEGRRAVGIEISEEYCRVAVDRLRQPSFFSIPGKPKRNTGEQLRMEICNV